MQVKSTRGNSTLKADGKALVFKDGVCEVKKTKGIQALLDAGYIEEVKDVKAIDG